MAYILRFADDSLKTKARKLDFGSFEGTRLNAGESKYELFDGENFDYVFDLAPIHDTHHDEKMLYDAKPFKGVITWFSYTHHKVAMAIKLNKNKRKNDKLMPSYNERPLDDSYQEVRNKIVLISFIIMYLIFCIHFIYNGRRNT